MTTLLQANAAVQFGGKIPVNHASTLAVLYEKRDTERRMLTDRINDPDVGLQDYEGFNALVVKLQSTLRAINMLEGKCDVFGREIRATAPASGAIASAAESGKRPTATETIPPFLSGRGDPTEKELESSLAGAIGDDASVKEMADKLKPRTA